jgi:hypothetical protein
MVSTSEFEHIVHDLHMENDETCVLGSDHLGGKHLRFEHIVHNLRTKSVAALRCRLA